MYIETRSKIGDEKIFLKEQLLFKSIRLLFITTDSQIQVAIVDQRVDSEFNSYHPMANGIPII